MTARELKIETEFFLDKVIYGVFFINQDLIAISYEFESIDIRNKDDLSLILNIPFNHNVYSFNKTARYYLFGGNRVLLITNHYF